MHFLCLLLQALFLVNNQISKIHPKAFQNMGNLRLLYLSYNLLTQVPENLPKNILELRIHDNRISRIHKDAFKGMQSLHVLGMVLWLMKYHRFYGLQEIFL